MIGVVQVCFAIELLIAVLRRLRHINFFQPSEKEDLSYLLGFVLPSGRLFSIHTVSLMYIVEIFVGIECITGMGYHRNGHK